MGLQDIVADGQLLVASLIALLAGIISFASPCVLPLVPGYLAYVGGVAGDSGDGRAHKGRVFLGSVLFIAGFTAVFMAIMTLAGSVGSWMVRWEDVIIRVMGVVVIVMGLVFMGQFGAMQRTQKINIKPKVGLIGAPVLGVVFAIGWAPCMGPTLTTIFALSFDQGSVSRAATLAMFYCIGLGLPFMLIALGFGWMTRVTGFLKRHIRAINIAGGVLMMLIGVLMVTGLWSLLMSQLQVVISGFVTPL